MKKMNALLWISIILLLTGIYTMAKDYTAIFTDLNNLKAEYILRRNITGFLTFFIGLCGIATSTFQKLKKEWAQRSIFWLGTVIAILTLVQSTFFPSSFQDYNKSAHRIDMAVRNITLLQNEQNFTTTPEEKQELENEIRDTIMNFYNSIEFEPVALSEIFSSSLYAQVVQMAIPQWLESKSYADADGNLFFVGEAKRRQLRTAKQQSRKLAQENAVNFWNDQFKENVDIDSQQLAEYLVTFGEFETGHFTKNADSTFTYSTLFKIQKQVLRFAINFYEIQERTKVNEQVKKQILDTKLPKLKK